MNIQTISIVVPTKGCVNKCPFCVSRMHESCYENKWNEEQMSKRIKYAVMNGVNTCILTGTGEAMQNGAFLSNLSELFRKMDYPFPNVELQTTGVYLSMSEEVFENDKLIKRYTVLDFLEQLGVNTISLSISDVFDDLNNLKLIGVSKKLEFNLTELVPLLKERGFNVRFSLNMLQKYDHLTPGTIIDRCKFLGANQITFRKMYIDGKVKSPESEWVIKNACLETTLWNIKQYVEGGKVVKGYGEFLYKLPFGGKVYSIEGMSTVMDDDCMSKENNDALKYIVLREDGKLYCRWDDKGSLIF